MSNRIPDPVKQARSKARERRFSWCMFFATVIAVATMFLIHKADAREQPASLAVAGFVFAAVIGLVFFALASRSARRRRKRQANGATATRTRESW